MRKDILVVLGFHRAGAFGLGMAQADEQRLVALPGRIAHREVVVVVPGMVVVVVGVRVLEGAIAKRGRGPSA